MEKIKRRQRHSLGSMELSVLDRMIISAFFPEAEEMTIKDLQERVDYSYERVNSSLKLLAEKKIVIEKQRGKTLVYSLDLQNLYAEIGFSGYMLDREIDFIKKHKIVYNAIKEIISSPLIWEIILFGSYSKGTETNQSDIDLICITYKKEEAGHFVKSLRHKYNLKFSPIISQDFNDIKKDNPELWHDLKIYGIVFKGKDNFYYWMYKDEKN